MLISTGTYFLMFYLTPVKDIFFKDAPGPKNDSYKALARGEHRADGNVS